MKCAICECEIEKKFTPDGVMYWDKGEDGWPVVDGRVCGIFYHDYFIPRRLALIYEQDYMVDKWGKKGEEEE